MTIAAAAVVAATVAAGCLAPQWQRVNSCPLGNSNEVMTVTLFTEAFANLSDLRVQLQIAVVHVQQS